MQKSKVILGADHAGYRMKEALKKYLLEQHYEVEDVGAHDETSSDHPAFAKLLAQKVLEHPNDSRGVLVCGTGIGMCITANKFRGIRAALATDPFMAEVSRAHNNANVLCLGARVLDAGRAAELVRIFLTTEFLGESEPNKYRRRVDMYEDGQP